MEVKIFRPTEIVRRIDDLGRIVIPRDLRTKCGIKEGDPFEVFVEKETRRILLIPYTDMEE